MVYVKVPATGRGWSAQLFSAAQRSEGGTCQMPVSIDGPYGSGHTLGDRALEAAVFVAGGIGVRTFMIWRKRERVHLPAY